MTQPFAIPRQVRNEDQVRQLTDELDRVLLDQSPQAAAAFVTKWGEGLRTFLTGLKWSDDDPFGFGYDED
jgi:hypothetical protein